MGLIKDSSEMKEAARLMGGLLGPLRRSAGADGLPEAEAASPAELADTESAAAGTETAEAVPVPGYAECAPEGTRRERMEAALELLRVRGGYDGCALVDEEGFVAAFRGSGYSEREVAALSLSLADARRRFAALYGAGGDGVATTTIGEARVDLAVIEAGGAVFMLAGLSRSGSPGPAEFGEALRYIRGLLE